MSLVADTVNESDGSVIVCAEVVAGDISECETSVLFGLTKDTACKTKSLLHPLSRPFCNLLCCFQVI